MEAWFSTLNLLACFPALVNVGCLCIRPRPSFQFLHVLSHTLEHNSTLTPSGKTLLLCIEEDGVSQIIQWEKQNICLPSREILNAQASGAEVETAVEGYRNQCKKLFYFRCDVTVARVRVLSLGVIEGD